jgi:hypothetical protein
MKTMTKTLSALAGLAIVAGSSHAAVIGLTDATGNTGTYSVTRNLGTTISGDTALYILGTMNFNDPTRTVGQVITSTGFNVANFAFTGANKATAGQLNLTTKWGLAGGGSLASTVDILDETPTLVLMKVDQMTDDAWLWLNPNLALPENLGDAVVTRNATAYGDDVNQVLFRGGFGGGSTSNPVTVGYTGFSVYYGGSTPFAVPEPGSLALLGMGGLAVLCVLRRRRASAIAG